MIELIDVGKYYPTEFGKHWVFRHVTLTLDLDKSVAVIGPNGAGKSTFLRILAGADIPSEGRVIRRGHISPPMGLTPTLQANLSGTENARFAGRIYGLSRDEINDMIEVVRDTADIGKYFDMPVSTYSAGMRQRVAFSINMALDFDFYLFDEISAGGDREFRKFSKARVQERLKTSKFIVASHHYDDLLDLCDAAIVIQNGELQYFEDIQEALSVYDVDSQAEDDSQQARRRARRQAREERLSGDDGNVEGDGASAGTGDPVRTPRDPERAALRERRLAKLQALAASTTAPEPGQPPAGISDEDARRQRFRELRAQFRALRREEDETRPTKPENTAGPGVADAALSSTASSADASVEPTGDAIPSAARERLPAHSNVDAAVREQRALKLRQLAERREKRRAKAEASHIEAMPETDAAALPGTADAAPAASSPEAAGEPPRTDRRERRKTRKRDDGISAAEVPLEDAESDGHSLQAAETSPERPAETTGDRPDPLRQLRELARTLEDDWPSREAGSSAATGGEAAVLRRAAFHQERAQTRAARALRLLLQHLDQTDYDGEVPSPQRRLSLITAAQESASSESAAARSFIETGSSGDSPPSSAHPAGPLRRQRKRAAHNMKHALPDSD